MKAKDTPEIFKETQDAIDALGASRGDPNANRALVEQMLGRIAAGHWGIDEQAFAHSFATSIYKANASASTHERADAVLRAAGLAGEVDKDAKLVEFVQRKLSLNDFVDLATASDERPKRITRAKALRSAVDAGLLPENFDEKKTTDRISAKLKKQR